MAGGTGRPVVVGAPALRDVTEAIIAQTTLGIWVLDADDCTTFVNERMAEMVLASPDEMLGAPVYDYLDPVAGESTRVALERRRTGVSELRELVIARSDGSELHT